jgi:hypothetical protein
VRGGGCLVHGHRTAPQRQPLRQFSTKDGTRSPTAVFFQSGKESHQVNYANLEQAELVAELANREIRGQVEVPKAAPCCRHLLEQLRARLSSAEDRFSHLAGSRTGTQSLQENTAALLLNWYIHGKKA